MDINPRNSTRESFEQSHLESACNDLDEEVNFKRGSGNDVSVLLSCSNCDESREERYILDYTERQRDDKRWSRNEVPSCQCEESGIPYVSKGEVRGENGYIFISSYCEECGDEFEDRYSFVDTF